MKQSKHLVTIMLLFFGSMIFGQEKIVSVVVAPSAGNSSMLQVEGPIAEGKSRFLGCAYSNGQATNFQNYWNQVTPENGGKWDSVEGTRNVMNWSSLDAAYNTAK